MKLLKIDELLLILSSIKVNSILPAYLSFSASLLIFIPESFYNVLFGFKSSCGCCIYKRGVFDYIWREYLMNINSITFGIKLKTEFQCFFALW